MWRKGPTSILLHVDIQLSQHRLLKIPILPPLNCPGTLVKNQLTLKIKSLLLNSHSLPLMPAPHCLNYCRFAASSEAWKQEPSGSALLCRDCSGCCVPCDSVWILVVYFLYWNIYSTQECRCMAHQLFWHDFKNKLSSKNPFISVKYFHSIVWTSLLFD